MSYRSDRDYTRLAIHGFARAGWLQPGHVEEFQFHDAGGSAATLKLVASEDQMTIEIARDDTSAKVSREVIAVDYSGCHLGGRRAWWTCPQCGSRRGVLFGDRGRWLCRVCLSIPYRSQRCSKMERLEQKVRTMRGALGGGIEFDGNARPARPLGMRRRRYLSMLIRLCEARRALAKLHRESFDREILGWTKTGHRQRRDVEENVQRGG